jgi:hypothetical protein
MKRLGTLLLLILFTASATALAQMAPPPLPGAPNILNNRFAITPVTTVDFEAKVFFERHKLSFPSGDVTIGTNQPTFGATIGVTQKDLWSASFSYIPSINFSETITPSSDFIIDRVNFNQQRGAATTVQPTPLTLDVSSYRQLIELSINPWSVAMQPYAMIDIMNVKVTGTQQGASGGQTLSATETRNKVFWGLGAKTEWRNNGTKMTVLAAFGPKFNYARGELVFYPNPNIFAGLGYELRTGNIDNVSFNEYGPLALAGLIF